MAEGSRSARILVALDLGEDSEHVVEVAATLARRLGADLELLHVRERGLDPDPEGAAACRSDQEAAEVGSLLVIADQLRSEGLGVAHRIAEGGAVEVLLEAAREPGVEYLVLGIHRRGLLYEALLGSVSRGLLEASPCPVVAVPAALAEAVAGEPSPG